MKLDPLIQLILAKSSSLTKDAPLSSSQPWF